MASTVGNRTITEYGINVLVESEDGRLRASSRGQATMQMNLTVNRAAVGVLNSVSMNPLVICFDAQVPEDLPGTKKYLQVAQPRSVGAQVQEIFTNTINIQQVPAFPIDLTTELFDLNVKDADGGLMVATVREDGSMVGDVDVSKSSYDPATGRCIVVFERPLKADQAVLFIKRFTVPSSNPREAQKVLIPDLVPYTSERKYNFVLTVFDPRNNKHFPVAPGTVNIQAVTPDRMSVRVTDNGEGKLIGNIDPSGANYIHYDTGEISVTFARYLKAESPIVVEYASYMEVFEYQKDSAVPVRMKIVLNWEDLARIVKAAEQTADSVEDSLKYRANT